MEHDQHPTSSNAIKHAFIDFIGGTLGGIATVYIGQPLDTVKKTYNADGIAKGLFAGTLPAIIANVAENSVLFAGYGFCQDMIMKWNNLTDIADLTIRQNATAGFWAAGASSLTLCPTELIKCKLQAMHEMQNMEYMKKKIGPVQLTHQLIKTEGIRGLFSGLGPTLLREMPGYFCFFGGYEATREYLREPDEHKDDIGMLKTMFAGAVGGTVYWCLIFPVDVVKSRMQITNTKATFIELCVQILKYEGVFAFYNGLLPTLCRTGPATAVLFVVYEDTKKILNALL